MLVIVIASLSCPPPLPCLHPVQHYRNVCVEYECEVHRISTPAEEEHSWPLLVELTNGKTIGCDLVVSATGVLPNTTALIDKTGASVSMCICVKAFV